MMEKVAQMLYRLADSLETGTEATDVVAPEQSEGAETPEAPETPESVPDATADPDVEPQEVGAPSFVCQRCGHEETLEEMNSANKEAAGETPVEDITVEDNIQCPQCEGGVMLATFDDGSDDSSEEPAVAEGSTDGEPTEQDPVGMNTEPAPELGTGAPPVQEIAKVAFGDAQKAIDTYMKLKKLPIGARAALSRAVKWTGKTLGEMVEAWSEVMDPHEKYPFQMLEKFYEIKNSAELADAMVSLKGLEGRSLKQEWRDEIMKALQEAIMKYTTGDEQNARIAELGTISQKMHVDMVGKTATEHGGPDEMMLVLFGVARGILAPDRQYTPEALASVRQAYAQEHGELGRTAADAPADDSKPIELNIDVKSNLNKIYEQGAPIINKYLSTSKNEDSNAAIAKFMSVIGVDRTKVSTLIKELATVAPPKNIPGQKIPAEFLKDNVSLTDVVREQTLLVVLLEFLLAKGTYRPEDLVEVDKAFNDLRASMKTYMVQLFPAYDTLGLLPLAAADIFAKPGQTVAKQASLPTGLDLGKVARYL